MSLDCKGEAVCGGAIVSSWHILTAAHCVQDAEGTNPEAKDMRVHVGTATTDGGTIYSVSQIRAHPQFDKADVLFFSLTLFIQHGRVGHRVLFRSKRSVLFHSFKECNILFCSFFEFLATYETQKNVPFFSVLF